MHFSRLLLLPETVDDYVGADNPVRVIDAIVDQLDLAAAGFSRVAPKATGRPGYAPGDLLKLYIYGYLNRVRSSRRLEAEAHRNIEVIWLLRSLKPDFKTIADFRNDNRAAFKKVFREFVILCRRFELFGRELLAVDGTRIKAVNNKDRNFTTGSLQKFIAAADKKLEDYLNRVRSSRRLEAEAHRNIEVIWLLRSLKPDFKTIADFRSDNRAAFKKVFREFVILCRRLDLFGRELLAVDGTRIKAVNNKDRNFTKGSRQKFIAAADKKLEDYLNRLDAGDAEECATSGSRVKNLAEKIAALKKKRGEYAAYLSALEKNGESQISLTDPDSRAMAAHTKVGVGYNAQIAVDAKHKMIVEQAVTMFWTWACCNRPPSPRARFLTSRKSMSWPTRVILGRRTSPLVKKPASRPMCQSHNVDPRWQAVSSGRMSFATTPRKTPIFVLAGMN